MEVFPGFLLLLLFTAHNTFCKSLEDEEVDNMLLNEGQFIPGIWNMSKGEEAEVMSQSPGPLSSPGKARVKTKESKVKLTWTKALEIEVTFANGTEEKIHLKAVSNMEGGEIPCLYTGSLDHDSDDSEVTVDGCKGDPQVLVEIASRKEVGGLLVLVIENEETYQLQPEKTHWNRNDTHKMQSKGTQNLNFEASLPATRRSRLPREVTLKTWLVSDESLLSKFDHDKGRVRNHLLRLAQMAKPILRLLDVKVNLEVRGVEHYRSSIDTSENSLKRIRNNFRGMNIKGPVSFFTAQAERIGGWVTYGIAYPGTACKTRSGSQININWVQREDWGTVLTFAHELGHNIGMRHDHDHGSHCDGKGIMSYGDHPKTWSTCSNKDFASWYQNVGRRCL